MAPAPPSPYLTAQTYKPIQQRLTPSVSSATSVAHSLLVLCFNKVRKTHGSGDFPFRALASPANAH